MRRQAGFTIAEIMVASVTLLVGMAMGLAAFGEAETRTADALRVRDAANIGEQIKGRLMSLSPSLNSCPGSAPDPLRDVDTGNSLNCIGSDADGAGGVNCEPDHPVDANELRDVVAANGATRNYSASYETGNLGTVMYQGTPFRVVWNVSCGVPAADMRYTRLFVIWPPYSDAIEERRFLRFDFIKGAGL